MNTAYIYDAIRTPRGRAKESGGLYDLSPFTLLEVLYQALASRTGLNKEAVADVILGCSTQVGEQAGNIAKASLLYAGWPDHLSGMTINRYCASGLEAVNLAALKINVGQASSVVAGGVEMMSRVPMLSDDATVFKDAQLAAKCRMLMMGNGADLIASLYDISREEADQVALTSQQRAAIAREQGWFKSIIPVENPVKGITVNDDECIRPQTTMRSLSRQPPAFEKLGSFGIDAIQLADNPLIDKIHHIHTVGNSPAMADAAALVLVGGEDQQRQGLTPRARIVSSVSVCDDPLQVISGCVFATKKLLDKEGLSEQDIDLFELHEAFAATMIKCQRDLNINEDKLNVNGGVIALGHPMGATGAIMLGTLLDELERRDLRRGVVAASGAAGTGTAMLIERL